MPDCPRCVNAKNVLTALSYTVIERDVDALVRGEYHDIEALAELSLNGGTAPVVVVDDRAVREGDDLYSLMKEHKEW